MENKELAVIDMSLVSLGEILQSSGYFQDTKSVAQAIVKVLAGRELGFGPIASMTGFYIISGRICMSANLIGAAIKRSGKYDYKVVSLDDKACSLEFFENRFGKWERAGYSTFSIEDARKAATKNLDKFPRNMLFARAMSNGAKWFAPDVFGGPVYTPDEIESASVVDGNFNVVEPPSAPAATTTPKSAPVEPAAQATEQATEQATTQATTWPTEVVKWAADKWKANPKHVIAMLNKSVVLRPDFKESVLKYWIEIYRTERDAGVKSDEAALRADADWTANEDAVQGV